MMTRLLFTVFLLAASVHTWADASVRAHPLHLEKNYRQDHDASVMRTPDGYLWISTNAGLKRYDGYSLKVFHFDPQDVTTLGSPNVTRTYLHSDGTFWALGSVLNRYHAENETFTRYLISNYQVMYGIAEADLVQASRWRGPTFTLGRMRRDGESEVERGVFFDLCDGNLGDGLSEAVFRYGHIH